MWSPLAKLLGREPINAWYDKDVNEFTPDMAELAKRPFHRVFIPDEMMSPHFQNSLLGEGSVLRCWAFTTDKFSLWRKKLGKASLVIPLETKFKEAPYASLRGELYKVPTENIPELDNYKANGVEFIRKRVSLAIPYTAFDTKPGTPTYRTVVRKVDTSIDAWMYVGSHETWNPRFVKGSKIKYINKDGTTVGRLSDGHIYVSVREYTPRNKLLENYCYYAPTEYVGDS